MKCPETSLQVWFVRNLICVQLRKMVKKRQGPETHRLGLEEDIQNPWKNGVRVSGLISIHVLIVCSFRDCSDWYSVGSYQ